MTIPNENQKNTEQIKNKKMVPDDFYNQLKSILDQDEYDLFKTKSKKKLESRLNESDMKIQKLLSLKLRSTDEIKKLSGIKKNLKMSNLKLKESIIAQLDLEVA